MAGSGVLALARRLPGISTSSRCWNFTRTWLLLRNLGYGTVILISISIKDIIPNHGNVSGSLTAAQRKSEADFLHSSLVWPQTLWPSFSRSFASPLVHREPRYMRADIITSRVMDAESAGQVLQAIGEQMANPNLDLTALAAAIVRMTHLQHTLTENVFKDPYMTVLISHTVSRLRSVARRGTVSQQRECANILWAVAKLGDRWSGQLSSLQAAALNAVKVTTSKGDDQQIANVIWASAVLRLEGTDRHELLSAAAGRMAAVAEQFIRSTLQTYCGLLPR